MNFKWLNHSFMVLILLALCLPHNMSAIITPIKPPHIQDQEVALLIKQKAIEKQKQIDAQKKRKREQMITATILVLAAVGITGWITYWLKSQFSKNNNQKDKSKTEQNQNVSSQPLINEECLACYEKLNTFNANQIFSMPCKHGMCKTCADGWFFINNRRPNSTCPYCRQNVPLSLCAEQLKDYPNAKAYLQTQARLNQRQPSPQHFAPAQFGLRNINDDRFFRLMMANFNLQFV